MSETSSTVKDMFGETLYQRRARQALPILIRQAHPGGGISYGNLAEELEMSNARNLNYVLGSIGKTLNDLSLKWNDAIPIPPIQSLVINKHTGLPGSGFDGFLAERKEEYRDLGRRGKKLFLETYWADIYAYPRWNEVLEACELEPANSQIFDDIRKGANGRGGGEGPAHLALKNYVSKNPHIVGLSPKHPVGSTEFDLPSGDNIDVVFEHRAKVTAVEVKSEISTTDDIARGLFQCVKYKAVLEAQHGFEQTNFEIQTLLVLEGKFPSSLIGLRNCLGIKVKDNVKPE